METAEGSGVRKSVLPDGAGVTWHRQRPARLVILLSDGRIDHYQACNVPHAQLYAQFCAADCCTTNSRVMYPMSSRSLHASMLMLKCLAI